MTLLINKYGGKCLKDPAHINKVAKHIIKCKKKGHDLVVVVSAMTKETNRLRDLAYETYGLAPYTEVNAVLSTGEVVSANLLSIALTKYGYKSVVHTAHSLPILGDHTIDDINTNEVFTELMNDKIVIVTGYQALDSLGRVTTLGRGGSDLTAVAFAHKLDVNFCTLHTDVDGIYEDDPKMCPESNLYTVLTYDKALECSNVQEQALHYAKQYGINIRVRSIDSQGSIITSKGDDES